jgi:hypothetical protein
MNNEDRIKINKVLRDTCFKLIRHKIKKIKPECSLCEEFEYAEFVDGTICLKCNKRIKKKDLT